ncbi:uncharacterized protein LOC142981279 [Anticarsia gemmatalis]|uniref:uncharacterized protein LOC142981279 n=1 Tax=Anticarsia gemmatalis TaxID=129554 RepID=UPI003F772AEC
MLRGVVKHKYVYRVVKSDRINALRKQYDAFLEEDKKRKERNEYILGRLDKMRYSNALVPVRQKPSPSPLMNRSQAIYQLGYPSDAPIVPDFQPSIVNRNHIIPDIPVAKIDNTYLIQEISKNYILIPKLRSQFVNVPQNAMMQNTDIGDIHIEKDFKTRDLKPSPNENTDWKSKYEILNILKKEESEKPTVKFSDARSTEATLNKEPSYDNNYQNNVVNCDTNLIPAAHSDTGYKYLEELPEKDMPVENVNYEMKINETNDSSLLQAGSDINSKAVDILPASVDTVAEIDYKLQNTSLEQDYSAANEYSETNPTVEVNNYPVQDEYNYTESMDPNMTGEQVDYTEHFDPEYNVNDIPEEIPTETNVESNENIYREKESDEALNTEVLAQQFHSEDPGIATYVDEQDVNQAQAITSNDFVEEINQNVVETTPSEFVEYATEDINVQEMQAHTEVQMKAADDSTSRQEVDITNVADTEVVHEQVPQMEIAPENQEVVEQEQPVDAASIEAFDAEQKEMFYAENVAEDYEYQQNDPNAYTQDYPVAYHQNQDYAYYGENQQDAYPLNEGEEQTMRYDPSYQQQYVDSYEKAYEQQQPQLYEESQNYEQMPPEQLEQVYDQPENTSGEIETVLDTEEGYVEQKPEAEVKQMSNTQSSPEQSEQVA